MKLTAPTKGTRAYMRQSDVIQRQLRDFLKTKGCTSRAKREAAKARASVRYVSTAHKTSEATK